MNFIKSYFKKTELSFKRLGEFYLLNLIIFAFFFIVFNILAIISVYGVKPNYRPFSSLIIVLLVAFFAYAYINISHSLFEKLKLKKLLKASFNAVKRISSYASVYLTFLLLVLYTVIFYLFGLLGKKFFYSTMLKYYAVYTKIFFALFLILFYLVIFFNRIYFYLIVKKFK